ncbi:MAG: hypothetical protein RLY86_4479, partial [Pseudomonadota bacterium]
MDRLSRSRYVQIRPPVHHPGTTPFTSEEEAWF